MSKPAPSVTRLLIGLLIAAVVGGAVWYFHTIVVYLLVSALLAIIFNPIVDYLLHCHVGRFRLSRSVAALVTLLLIWLIVGVLCTLFLPLVFHKIFQFASLDFRAALDAVAEPLQRLQEYLQSLFAIPDDRFTLTDSLAQWLRSLVDYDTLNAAFSSIVTLSLSVVVAIFSISFITFFFLKDDTLFVRMLQALFPERMQSNVERAVASVTSLLMRYFRGLLLESCLLLVVISLVLMLFGMKSQDAFFIGLTMGVMNVIPYAGPLLGGVMSLFLGMTSPIEGTTALYTSSLIVVILLVIKSLDDFVLQPTLYSERIKAHPLEVFLVILIAGSLAGVVGMLVAIPIYTVLRVFAKEFLSQFRLVQKLTEKI
jgi:predicted PurR-regulated permease PerM